MFFTENRLTNLLECYYEDCPLRFIAIGRPMVSQCFYQLTNIREVKVSFHNYYG